MRMKPQYICHVLIVVFCLSPLFPNSIAATEGINWRTYDEGMASGRTEKKKVLLHFYANWCFYCRKMAKETLQDPSVVSYLNKNFISIRVDCDKDGRTASRYGVRGLPSTWFLTEKGEGIGNLPGYLPAGRLLQVLKQITAGAPDTRRDK
jgi:thioredoxin-related protein